MVSEREIRRKYEEHFEGEVSSECIVYTKDVCDDLIDKVIGSGVKEFHEHNKLREIQHLPKLKRVTLSIFKKVVDELFKTTSDNLNEGNGAQFSRDTSLSYKQDIEVV